MYSNNLVIVPSLDSCWRGGGHWPRVRQNRKKRGPGKHCQVPTFLELGNRSQRIAVARAGEKKRHNVRTTTENCYMPESRTYSLVHNSYLLAFFKPGLVRLLIPNHCGHTETLSHIHSGYTCTVLYLYCTCAICLRQNGLKCRCNI